MDKHNFLAGKAKEGSVLFPGSVVTAKQKQGTVRGIVKYVTVWHEFTSSAPARVVAYMLTSGIGVKHSDIESVLHRAPGDMSVVDAAVGSATFGLELEQDKISCPLTASAVLKGEYEV